MTAESEESLAGRFSQNQSVIGYVALAVPQELRDQLQKLLQPRYPQFHGQHITLKTGLLESSREANEILSAFKDAEVNIYGAADDGLAVQCFLAHVNGAESDASGRLYHITWSIDLDANVYGSYNEDGRPGKAEARHAAYVAAQEKFVIHWPRAGWITTRLSPRFYPKPELAGRP